MNKGRVCDLSNNSDEYLAYVPNSESIYFSALDTTMFDSNTHYDKLNDFDCSSLSSSSSSNYYSSLRPVRQLISTDDDDYTSLRPSDFNPIPTENEMTHNLPVKFETEIDQAMLDDTENDSVIAAYAQLEEFERAGRRSLDYVRYSECLDRIEKTIFESFEGKVKTKKIKHYSIDQTIEETLEETNYENVLDELIKKMAIRNPSSSRSSRSSESRNSERLAKRKDTNDEALNICKNSKRTSMSEKVFQTQSAIAEPKHYKIISHRISHLEILDECSSEYPLLEHAFNLAKRCNFGSDRFRRDGNYKNLVGLGNKASSGVIGSVAKVFISLFRLDFNQLLKDFISIPLKDRWNVLKNLIYYAIKLSLSAISDFFIDDVGEAFSQIIQSIYSYVSNFNRIVLTD